MCRSRIAERCRRLEQPVRATNRATWRQERQGTRCPSRQTGLMGLVRHRGAGHDGPYGWSPADRYRMRSQIASANSVVDAVPPEIACGWRRRAARRTGRHECGRPPPVHRCASASAMRTAAEPSGSQCSGRRCRARCRGRLQRRRIRGPDSPRAPRLDRRRGRRRGPTRCRHTSRPKPSVPRVTTGFPVQRAIMSG